MKSPFERDNKASEVILDSIADGVFTVDDQWRITSFNRAAEQITGIQRVEAIGRRCYEVFRASICEGSCAMKSTMENGRPIGNKAIYIVSGNGARIPVSISTALLKDAAGKIIGGVETFRDLSVVEELRRELNHKYTFADIISKNDGMGRIFDILPEIAESGSSVLLEGESGTGKELFARAIHDLSPRRKKRMVTVNCGALPDTLLESELFGYKAGAFTDARKDKQGRFAAAEGGTMFLDEIGDVSPALQVRLLRFLQEKTYEPLGGTESVKANVRIVAATNQNLVNLIGQGKFRKDLYYRINIIRLHLPPLRERKEDIPLLVEHFIGRFNLLRNKNVTGLSQEVMGILMGHDYPGNVRELENVIEHAFILCHEGLILPEHLPEYLRQGADSLHEMRENSFDDLQARFILEALNRNNWNRSATARDLGIHKTTLWRKMKKLGVSV